MRKYEDFLTKNLCIEKLHFRIANTNFQIFLVIDCIRFMTFSYFFRKLFTLPVKSI